MFVVISGGVIAWYYNVLPQSTIGSYLNDLLSNWYGWLALFAVLTAIEMAGMLLGLIIESDNEKNQGDA